VSGAGVGSEERKKLASEKDEISGKIRAMGRRFDQEVLQATYALYTPLQERASRDGVTVHRDLKYGAHDRHLLDLFVPRAAGRAPVVVYFHGGGYIGGQRSPVPGLIYDNVSTFFARHEFLGVNATYRLAPDYPWPSGGADVGGVVNWLRENVERFGGDPGRIVLVGQSAGATHVATWALDSSVHGAEGPRVKGIALLSGVFGPCHPSYFADKPAEPHRLAYFGAEESRWRRMSPINAVRPGHPPVLVSVAEFDPWPLQWSSPAMIEALSKCDREMPWVIYNRGHNHISPALQINSSVDDLGPQLLEFVRAVI
jgi:acetyl esterase